MAETLCDVLDGRRRVGWIVQPVHDVIRTASSEAVPSDGTEMDLDRDVLHDLDVLDLDVGEQPPAMVLALRRQDVLQDADTADGLAVPDVADAEPPYLGWEAVVLSRLQADGHGPVLLFLDV